MLGRCPGDEAPPTSRRAAGSGAGSVAMVNWSVAYTPATGLLEESVFSGW